MKEISRVSFTIKMFVFLPTSNKIDFKTDISGEEKVRKDIFSAKFQNVKISPQPVLLLVKVLKRPNVGKI